jgi:hypothetical protein
MSHSKESLKKIKKSRSKEYINTDLEEVESPKKRKKSKNRKKNRSPKISKPELTLPGV